MREIYLDNGATTRPSPKVVAKMMQVLTEEYGNPSSLHRKGQQAEKYVEEARRILAEYLRVDPVTLYFTSGGTECSNTAIFGAARRSRPQRQPYPERPGRASGHGRTIESTGVSGI